VLGYSALSDPPDDFHHHDQAPSIHGSRPPDGVDPYIRATAISLRDHSLRGLSHASSRVPFSIASTRCVSQARTPAYLTARFPYFHAGSRQRRAIYLQVATIWCMVWAGLSLSSCLFLARPWPQPDAFRARRSVGVPAAQRPNMVLLSVNNAPSQAIIVKALSRRPGPSSPGTSCTVSWCR
jgi:hypothetical protein